MWALFLWMHTSSKDLLYGLAERTDNNQLSLFTASQNHALKALAMTASLCSICFCLLSFYMYLAIDPKRMVFRHQLVAFLLSFDLLKATTLLIFPTRTIINGPSYMSHSFRQVVGFFTATATEGADFAILAFAIHTFLLIFKPSMTVKIPGTHHVEGGLYKYRYFIYSLALVLPLALASFPFIGKGYIAFVSWCYLPQKPYWYRAALSWAPRFVIVIVIIGVYLLIYVHVLREFRLLGGTFSRLQLQKLRGSQGSGKSDKPSFFSSLAFFFRDVRTYLCPPCGSSGSDTTGTAGDSLSTESSPNSNKECSEDPKAEAPGGPLDLENNLGNAEFHAANLENFQKRQKTIEKQMKSIFVYPIAYVSIWVFPFALYCTQLSFEQKHGPVVWLNFICAFMQPFMGTVDSLVFFYRERPWKYTIMKNFERENESRLDLVLAPAISSADNDSITTSMRFTKCSLALGMNVDMKQYSRTRRFLSKCKLPLMLLPTEENIVKFQAEHFKRKMETVHTASRGRYRNLGADQIQGIDGLQAKHDFSNLLRGGNVTGDVAQKFDGYSLSFQDDSRKPSFSSGNISGKDRRPSVATISNQSAKSRRVSVFEGHDPIPENGSYVKSLTKPNKQAPRKSVQTIESAGDEEELDLLDFLGRGPK